MSGLLLGAAQWLRQRFYRFGQRSFTGDQQLRFSDILYQLDQLALVEIKRHLTAVEGIYFEPLSSRFASININRRLSLHVTTIGSSPSQQAIKLIVEEKNGKKISIVAVKRPSQPQWHWLTTDIDRLLTRILSRIFKFAAIIIRSGHETIDYERTEQLMKSLLVAAVEFELTDVRSFELLFSDYFLCSMKSVAAWISQISPSLCHLRISKWSSPVGIEEPLLVMAIGRCERLRFVDLHAIAYSSLMMAGLLDSICARPKLTALRFIGDPVALPPLPMPMQRFFEVDAANFRYWMKISTDLPSLKQFSEGIDSFIFHYRHWRADCFPLISALDAVPIERFASWHRRPLPLLIIVRYWWPFNGQQPSHLKWKDDTLNNWLLVASRCRVLLKIVCPCQLALPTVEQFAAIKEVIEEENIPGLMSLPAHDPQQMTFSFLNGAKVELLLEE